MQPDPTNLLNKIGSTHPLIGVYDAPDPSPFGPRVRPKSDKWACVFMFYKEWLKGEHSTSPKTILVVVVLVIGCAIKNR